MRTDIPLAVHASRDEGKESIDMQLILDRVESEIAVCEYAEGKTIQFPAALLPADAKEGSVLRLVVDSDASQSQKDRAEELRSRLFGRK